MWPSASATRPGSSVAAAHRGDDRAVRLVLLRAPAGDDEQVDARLQRVDRGLADAAAGRGGRRDEVRRDDRAVEAEPVAQLVDGLGQQRRGRDAVERGVDRVGHLDRRHRAIAGRDRLERLHVGVAQLVDAQADRRGALGRVLRRGAVAGKRADGAATTFDWRYADDRRLDGARRRDRPGRRTRGPGPARRRPRCRRTGRASCRRRARAAGGRRPSAAARVPLRALPTSTCDGGARLRNALNSPPSCARGDERRRVAGVARGRSAARASAPTSCCGSL